MTFHAACGRILRREAPRLGYRSNFTIYDSADQLRLTKQCLEDLERDPKRFTPRGIHSQISNAKNQLIGPDDYASRVASFYDQTVADVYKLYQTKMFNSNAVDFDDMLYLTVDVLERFPEAQEKWQKAFRYCSSTSTRTRTTRSTGSCSCSRRSTRTCSRWAIRTSRSTASEAPTSATCSSSSSDFPGAKTIALEQNYRSTNSILEAANGVISHNRERKPKNLWSELGDGEPVRVVEVEDEHSEARYVAAEIARLVEEGFNGSEIAVFYRTNAQSRVLEDVLVRQGVAYQVIGGPRFYERAEIKDLVAYLQVIDNPFDAVSLLRIANRPRRGIGDSTLAKLMSFADDAEMSLWEAMARTEAAGVGTAPSKAVASFRNVIQSLMSAAQELDVPELIERVLEQSGYMDSLEAERTIEAQGRIENLQELVALAREWMESAAERDALVVPAGGLALLRPGCDPRRRLARHADDAAQREGPRVPRGLPDRHGGGDLPALALDRGAGGRGGAAALLRRHDARDGAADADARLVADALRRTLVQPALALPRRAAGTPRRARPAAACIVVELRCSEAEPGRTARGRSLALDRRQRAARNTRRRRRRAHRARRRRHGALRRRRHASGG